MSGPPVKTFSPPKSGSDYAIDLVMAAGNSDSNNYSSGFVSLNCS